MRVSLFRLVAIVLPPLVAANCWNTIYLIFTFGIGGAINNACAQPKCTQGLERLGLQDSSCGCIADVESFPTIKGVAGCTSGVFCIEGDLCGDARTSMTFGSGGDLDTGEELYSYFLATTPSVYELRIIAYPQDSSQFGSCLATVLGDQNCQSCSICDDGVSFNLDCSDVTVNGEPGPVVTDCLNFMFMKV